MSQIDLFLLAAEPSGDLQGAKLVEQILKIDPTLHIHAMAGPHLRKLPIEAPFQMESLQVMGFIDVVKSLPRIVSQFFRVRNAILRANPKVVITVDYPGFHLRLARSLRKKGFRGKLIHYICPSVWAWGKKRISLMEQNLDLLLTLFPFEKHCFAKTKLAVDYVGHPLVSSIAPPPPHARAPILALFPGSRTEEIARNLPLQLTVAKRMQTDHPHLQIGISISSSQHEPLIRSLAQHSACQLIPPGHHYELMQRAQVAIATSGTVTLELALHETPTVVNFAIRPFDIFLARHIFRIDLPFYCIVNIIASQEIFPELFGPHFTEEALYAKVKYLWENPQETQEKCKEIRMQFSEKEASREAAEKIMKILR